MKIGIRCHLEPIVSALSQTIKGFLPWYLRPTSKGCAANQAQENLPFYFQHREPGQLFKHKSLRKLKYSILRERTESSESNTWILFSNVFKSK